MAEGNKSQVLVRGVEEGATENFSEFYKLHYQPKRVEESKNSIGFRAKSVNAIVQSKNPEDIPGDLVVRHKRSLKERIREHEKSKEKMRPQRPKTDKFSFRQVLSKQTKQEQIADYFTKHASKAHVDLQEYSRKNIGVKLAIQKCKDDKVKIQKVIASNKQSEETKLDYLQLKRRDIDEEIKNEIKSIYEEFFKKEYQEESSRGFTQFQSKIRLTMEILHQQMFGK